MRKNRGFILVSVMFATVTLLTSATAFAWFARTEARAAAARERNYLFRSVAEIAAKTVHRMITEDANGFDSFTEPLYDPEKYLEMEIGRYKVEVRVQPLNNKIPIGGLLLPDGVTLRSEYEAAWTNIWENIGLPRLAWDVLDFIDADSDQRLGGAERDININRMISDLSELRVIPEITNGVLWGNEDIPSGLTMYAAVGNDEKINVNVAAPEVLAALDDTLTLSHARNIVAYRQVNPIRDIDGLRKVPGFPPELATKLANVIAFDSTLFQINIKVSDEAGNVRSYRITIERGGSGFYGWEE